MIDDDHDDDHDSNDDEDGENGSIFLVTDCNTNHLLIGI